MPNIKPVSDLTKNGRGRYAIVDIEEYEKNQATIKLLSKLMEAEKAIKTGDEWLTEEQVEDDLGL
ncbi:MAG: prevent-host-death protein [Bacillus sp. (in: Bacteria)]|nr:prevent-host-death protein [Bacillus sp. (in: firmicutes)]